MITDEYYILHVIGNIFVCEADKFWISFEVRDFKRFLTLYLTNSFFVVFRDSYNLRQALFVYRLKGATFIGNFFDDPFLN